MSGNKERITDDDLKELLEIIPPAETNNLLNLLEECHNDLKDYQQTVDYIKIVIAAIERELRERQSRKT